MERDTHRLILAPEIQRLVLQKKLPLRGTEGLGRFSSEEQKWLAQNVFERVHLTTNQLIRFAEWASDIRKRDKKTLEEIFSDPGIEEALRRPKLDLRARGERLFERVRILRFPKLSQEAAKPRPGPGEESFL